MFFALVKKEIKQFLRSKGNVFMMFVFPIILITTLSAGLKDMMSNGNIFGTDNEYSYVYYSIEEESSYEDGFNSFKDAISDEANIKFEKAKDLEEVKDKVDKYDAMAHINVTKDGYEFYSSENGEKMKTKIFESIFESVLNEYGAYNTIIKYNPMAMRNLIENKYNDYVSKENLSDEVHDISSSEYYTFAELALIILYISGIISETVYKENTLTTINRIRMSKVREGSLIASKVCLGVLISVVQVLVVYLYSTLCLGVDWGNNIFEFFTMFISFGLFASMLGAIIGITAKKDTTASGICNMITIVLCFFGGCYTPLSVIMNMGVVSKLVNISPIYWINTAISSLLCGLESNAFFIATAVPIVLSLIIFIVYIAITSRKESFAND